MPKPTILSDYQQLFIMEQRHLGFGYSPISRKVGCHRQVVRRFCKSIGMAVDVRPNIIKANERTGLRKRKPVEIYNCKNCNKSYARDRKRHSNHGKQYCSRECAFEYKSRHKRIMVDGYFNGATCVVYFPHCEICNIQFTANHKDVVVCGRDCQLEKGRNKFRIYAIAKHADKVFMCNWCGELFQTEYGSKLRAHCSSTCKKCSQRWDRRYSLKHRDNKKIQNIIRINRIRLATVEDFEPLEIFDRDSWRCQLMCNKKLNPKNKVPHLKAATIGHIIPLSQGGLHERKNVQCACFECNSRKGDRTIDCGEQLRLVG